MSGFSSENTRETTYVIGPLLMAIVSMFHSDAASDSHAERPRVFDVLPSFEFDNSVVGISLILKRFRCRVQNQITLIWNSATWTRATAAIKPIAAAMKR